ncbi:hypothetical protein [Thermomicrobium sp.]|uniref:hypothetical protein n=1 Tax=Thermomicrobium sp. TaxID=1969469 RepID=UPI002580F45B|nr:hypothetical protein [Thermomicrobium sp.]
MPRQHLWRAPQRRVARSGSTRALVLTAPAIRRDAHARIIVLALFPVRFMILLLHRKAAQRHRQSSTARPTEPPAAEYPCERVNRDAGQRRVALAHP